MKETGEAGGGGELVVRNPRGSVEVAQEIVKWIKRRREEILAAADAIEITAENWNDARTKDALTELAGMVEDLRDNGKKLVAEVVAATEAQRVLTEIDARLWTYSKRADPASSYSQLKARLDALKAQAEAFKEAAMPKPKHTYVMQMECADDAFRKIEAKVKEFCGDGWRYAAPQSDRAFKAIDKWFCENLQAKGETK